MAVPATTPEGERAARDRFSGDWDEDGTVSVHLPRDVAQRLLAERGWQPRYQTRSGEPIVVGWDSPSGIVYWHTAEALVIALTAENA